MKIKQINFNWFSSAEGEEFSNYVVGSGGVIKIEENFPEFPGDSLNYLVTFEDGHKERIFNPNQVFYFPEVK